MINPARLDLSGDRWVAFIRSLPLIGVDLTGATFALQVRPVPDVSGTPLADLTNAASAAVEGVRVIYAGTDTVSNHMIALRLAEVPDGYEATDNVTLTLLGIRINETTMEGMPYPAERGDDAVFVWDFHITPTGGIKDKYAGGSFTVRSGATL